MRRLPHFSSPSLSTLKMDRLSSNYNKLETILLVISISLFILCTSNAQSQLKEKCSSDGDCAAGLYCSACQFSNKECVRGTYSDQFKLVNNSLSFNKYAFLTTHNSFAIEGEPSHTGVPRVTFTNQEDTITQQLQNGVRAFMLDTYDFKDTVWLCHSFDGKCFDFTAFQPAIDTLREIEAFLSSNPSEIVTLILEDYVEAPKGLTKVFTDSGLMKYWFPVSSMPQNGEDWPIVSDMIAKNQRLLVFTSKKDKEASEGIAYQWKYMVENHYGDAGMKKGSCSNRGESPPLDDKSKSLVLVNYFRDAPVKGLSCRDNNGNLLSMATTCHGAAANRWANFLAVDFYRRSEGGGAFEALDLLNGMLICGCPDVHVCKSGSAFGACQATR